MILVRCPERRRMKLDYRTWQCWPIPIVEYIKMIRAAYPDRAHLMYIVKWKLRDNYTFSPLDPWEED